MNLLVLTQHYPPDICSTGFLCSQVAEHRAQNGDRVTVVTGHGGYVAQPVAADQPSAVTVARVWSTNLGRSRSWRRAIDLAALCLSAAWRAVRLPRQDLILSVTTPPLLVWAAVLHKLLHPSTKIVLWSMDCYPEVAERVGVVRPDGLVSRGWRWLNRRLYRWLDAVVCLDGAMAELLRPYDAAGRVRFPVIPNWEPAAIFETLPPQRPGLADPSKLTVLYMGNAGYGHDFDTVIAAARELRNEPIEFLFVGGGRRWCELESAKQRFSLDNVRLLGYLNLPKEETPAALLCGDLALITLRDEMLGVMSPSKLHASLASGVGIAYVGPPDSNVADAIDQFDCGFCSPVGDASDLAEQLRRLATDRDAVAKLGRNARAAFEVGYCDAQALPQFDELFADLLTQPERTSMLVKLWSIVTLPYTIVVSSWLAARGLGSDE